MRRTGSLPGVIGRHAWAVAGVALALGLAVAGCGEKSEPATTGKVVTQTTSTTTTTDPVDDVDREMARTAAQLYLKSESPKVCTNVLAPAFLKQAYGTAKECASARSSGGVATRVKLETDDIVISGEKATVEAQASGGPYKDGRLVTVSLVRQGGGADWLVDGAQPPPPQ